MPKTSEQVRKKKDSQDQLKELKNAVAVIVEKEKSFQTIGYFGQMDCFQEKQNLKQIRIYDPVFFIYIILLIVSLQLNQTRN